MKKSDRDVYEHVMPEDPEKSSVYLDGVLERLKINVKAPENQLIIQWKSVIPEYISQHCICAGFKDSVLYVVCDNAAGRNNKIEQQGNHQTCQLGFPGIQYQENKYTRKNLTK